MKSYTNFFSLFVLWSTSCFMVSESVGKKAPVTVHVGKLGYDDSVDEARVVMSCINMSLIDFYETNGSNYKTRLLLHMKSSKGDVLAGAALALDLIKHDQVKAIIGPSTSMEANFVKAIGEKAQVPIITFSATDPSLTSVRSKYFFRATQNDSTQTKAISALMEAFGWRQAVPIYVDNEFGQGILPYLAEALQHVHASIPYSLPIPAGATKDQIQAALADLKTKSVRVFIVHTGTRLGRKIFSVANERLGMMDEGYVWIMTDAITTFLDAFNSSSIRSMQGALGVRPFVKRDQKFQDFERKWRAKFRRENPESEVQKLNINALWGSDAAIALAMAVEEANLKHWDHKSSNASGKGSDLNDIPVSDAGPKLLEALSRVSFRGLTGKFQFFDGQLSIPTYQIVNVNGNSYKGIGFWTPGKGLSKVLNKNPNTYSNSPSSLSSITWPGDSQKRPKGWELPISGKKLKIVVPVTSPFVRIDSDRQTERFSGYSIAVFEEVVKALPYTLPYEFVPFRNRDGSSNGTYNDMVYQVKLGNFDAAVGDITIVANRSEYVDFTMPYTDSGVSIIVRSSYGTTANPWIFMTPLTWQLWLVSLCFFIGIGFVVRNLEHRVNRQFRGDAAEQIGHTLYFSFSTMFFAHGGKIIRNVTKIVVIVWCFVVLILTQSYTAAFTSRLTVQQLQPVLVDIQDLKTRNVPIGYSRGSFVLGVLKQLKFEDRNLKPYARREDCHEMFENGTILAAIDETPYLRFMTAKHCNIYTTKPAFDTGGFGFVFPIGSPLTADISKAVVKVVTTVYNTTMDGQMNRIEEEWFSLPANCSDENSRLGSSQLNLTSFMGLFLIAGGTSFLAVVLAAVMECWNNMSFWNKENLRRRIRMQIAAYLIGNQPSTSIVMISNLDANPRTLEPMGIEEVELQPLAGRRRRIFPDN